ncbi:unnamed protein product [Closterium sp. Naga37s-1]|nr:unnamed protein product [Closterium sp. Naga37s-1]
MRATQDYLSDVEYDVFKHFRLIKVDEGKSQQYECKFCCNVFPGAAICCAKHLASWKKMKRREVALCKDAPSEVRAAMRKKYKAKAAAADQRRQATSDAIALVTSGGKRSRITDYLESDAAAGKRDAHEAFALMFVGCRIPERIAEHPLFINAVCAIRDANTGYVPPKKGFIGTAGLQLVDCRMETKTGGYVASILRPVVEEVRPENVVAFCIGGGSNYAVACNELIAEWPHIQHVPCGTHVMDPYMEDVGKMPWAKKEVDPAGEKISFVRNHHWTRGVLEDP